MVQENSIKNREKNIGDADRSKICGLRWGFLVFFFFFKCLVIVVLEDAPEKTKQTKQKHTDFKWPNVFFLMNLIIVQWYLC